MMTTTYCATFNLFYIPLPELTVNYNIFATYYCFFSTT
jgi:hypothetical protein